MTRTIELIKENGDLEAVFAEIVVPDPVPDPVPEVPAFLNLSNKLRLFTRGAGKVQTAIPASYVIQGIIDGPEVRMQGKVILRSTWTKDNPDAQDWDEWCLRFVGDLQPERDFNVYECAVGSLVLDREYKQRGLSGGNVFIERVDEADPNSELVINLRWGPESAFQSRQNRLSGNYPWYWEDGNSFTFELRFQRKVN